MDYPFIDFKKLSDDELMNRITRCSQILGSEMAYGHSSIVHSARNQLQAYQFEWNERMQARARKEYFEKNPRHDKPIEIGVISEVVELEDKDTENVQVIEEVTANKTTPNTTKEQE